jgi:hypothetical protein
VIFGTIVAACTSGAAVACRSRRSYLPAEKIGVWLCLK